MGGPCSNFRGAGIPFAVRSSVWLLIALTAALLRCWRLTWGLIDAGWFPDEGVFSARAAAFVPLSTASFALRADDLGYPTLCGYLSGAALAATHGLGLLALPIRPYAAAVIAGLSLVVPLACPPCALHADRMLAAMARFHAVTEMGWPFQNNCLVSSLGWYGRPYLYQLAAGLPFGLGWPLAVAALAGVIL